ncbi:Ring finger domain [Trypanosoma vivax]|uniref:RING-type domain-containing protein n=1 Tax=Trypanosoma vivax (strain Y486) TaxID=1055687 RepID=G0U261_TRYVY|nr:hypothetical protein TRVL_03997 [Trypanosoma vivax]KAH8611347.1 Ring finger domain [Trypanosoma vivax]CCC50364.1 conserved hypothetical protein [Trypanosoma vivax Y486]
MLKLPLCLYFCLSFVVPTLIVVDYVNVYREYFTVVVELTGSPLFRLLCVNCFVALTLALWFVGRYAFFGTLTHTERDVVHRTFLMYVAESLVGPFYFGVSVLSPIGLVSQLTIVVALLHKLAVERVTTLHMVEERQTRLCMLIRLLLFLVIFFVVDLYVILDVFGNVAWKREEHKGIQYCFAMLYMQYALTICKCLAEIFFAEIVKTSRYSNLAFYGGLFFSFTKSILFFISFSYVSAVAQAPFPLMRLLLHNIVRCFENFRSLLRYLTLTRFLRTLPSANEEALSRDPSCVICYDDMTTEQSCKQLPCGHCYHEMCLRRWFEKMSTCPYCRADLIERASSVIATAMEGRNENADTVPPGTGVQGQVTPGAPADTDEPDAADALPPPSEEEVLRAYLLHLKEHLSASSHTQTAVSGEETSSRSVNTAREETLGPSIVVLKDGREAGLEGSAHPGAPHVAHTSGAAGLPGDASVSSVDDRSANGETQDETRVARRLAAYMEFYSSVAAASETLNRKIRDIDAGQR